MEQRPITAGRSCVCWEVSKLTYTHLPLQAHATSIELELHIKRCTTWTRKLELPILNPERHLCLSKPEREESRSTHGLLDDLQGITRIRPPPRCHALFRKQRHKDNLMCMDFLLTVVRVSRVGLHRLCEDWGPQTAVIEDDSGLSTMTLWITAIITAIIITAALHTHKVLR